MKKTLSAIALAAIASGTLTLSWSAGLAPASAEAKAVERFHCPMHPSYVQDHAGDCPVCGMKLVPVKGAAEAAAHAEHANAPAPAAGPARPGQYTCPMHPEVVQDGEGRCPTCRMKLVRVEAPERAGPALAIAPDKQQILGIA